MTIRAIETRYAGHRFRSRLEARWAVFFDTLGIRWEYEQQGYHVGPYPTDVTDAGATIRETDYLPDFWLPGENTFFEVKGVAPDDNYRQMLQAFTVQAEADLLLAVGSIPNPETYEVACEETAGSELWMDAYFGSDPWINAHGEEERGGWDNYQAWCVCSSGTHFAIKFMGYGDRINCGCTRPDGKSPSGDHPMILAAYQAARSARFEHGESGA